MAGQSGTLPTARATSSRSSTTSRPGGRSSTRSRFRIIGSRVGRGVSFSLRILSYVTPLFDPFWPIFDRYPSTHNCLYHSRIPQPSVSHPATSPPSSTVLNLLVILAPTPYPRPNNPPSSSPRPLQSPRAHDRRLHARHDHQHDVGPGPGPADAGHDGADARRLWAQRTSQLRWRRLSDCTVVYVVGLLGLGHVPFG